MILKGPVCFCFVVTMDHIYHMDSYLKMPQVFFFCKANITFIRTWSTKRCSIAPFVVIYFTGCTGNQPPAGPEVICLYYQRTPSTRFKNLYMLKANKSIITFSKALFPPALFPTQHKYKMLNEWSCVILSSRGHLGAMSWKKLFCWWHIWMLIRYNFLILFFFFFFFCPCQLGNWHWHKKHICHSHWYEKCKTVHGKKSMPNIEWIFAVKLMQNHCEITCLFALQALIIQQSCWKCCHVNLWVKFA